MEKKKLQTLKVESVNEGVNAAQVANTEKGSVQNPYTIAELETMLEAGTWQGGYVESVGYNEEDYTSNYNMESYGYGGGYGIFDSSKPSDYTSNPNFARYQGSLYFNCNDTGCVYECIAHYANLPARMIADYYGDYLCKVKFGKKTFDELTWKKKQELNDMIGRGMSYERIVDFSNYLGARYNFYFEKITEKDYQANYNNDPNLQGIGCVKKSAGKTHAIIVHGASGTNLDYTDPNENSGMYYSPNNIITFYKIKYK